MRLRLPMSLAGMLAVAGIAAAQSSAIPGLLPPGRFETPHLSLKASTAVSTAAPGARLSLFLDVVPKPKMHVYSPEEEKYLPVSLQLERSPSFTAARAVFPKGERFFFAPLGETQIVYSRPFRIEQPVTLATGRSLAPGSVVTIKGTLRYQACDDAVCYVPKDVPVNWTLTVR